MMKKCKVDGCEREHKTKGYCKRHYQLTTRAAKRALLPPKERPSLEDRLETRSEINAITGCVEWTGAKDTSGYGEISVSGKSILTHRATWELVNGPIPDGLFVLHRCDNRVCRNIAHLFIGTHQDNVDDREAKGRNVVFRGEEHANAKLTEENVKEIREDLRSQMEIARDYGVCQALISKVKRGEAWRHTA